MLVRPFTCRVHVCLSALTFQILLGLHYLHTECGVIHTDIKPENILLCVDEEYVKSLVSDGARTRSAVISAPRNVSATKVS